MAHDPHETGRCFDEEDLHDFGEVHQGMVRLTINQTHLGRAVNSAKDHLVQDAVTCHFRGLRVYCKESTRGAVSAVNAFVINIFDSIDDVHKRVGPIDLRFLVDRAFMTLDPALNFHSFRLLGQGLTAGIQAIFLLMTLACLPSAIYASDEASLAGCQANAEVILASPVGGSSVSIGVGDGSGRATSASDCWHRTAVAKPETGSSPKSLPRKSVLHAARSGKVQTL